MVPQSMSAPGVAGPLVAVHTEVVRREHLTPLIDHAASGVAITVPSASLRNDTGLVPKLLAEALVADEGAAPATAFYAKGRESSYLHAESQGELVLHQHGDLDPLTEGSGEATKAANVSLANGHMPRILVNFVDDSL